MKNERVSIEVPIDGVRKFSTILGRGRAESSGSLLNAIMARIKLVASLDHHSNRL